MSLYKSHLLKYVIYQMRILYLYMKYSPIHKWTKTYLAIFTTHTHNNFNHIFGHILVN